VITCLFSVLSRPFSAGRGRVEGGEWRKRRGARRCNAHEGAPGRRGALVSANGDDWDVYYERGRKPK